MSLQRIKDEALHLPKDERLQLLQSLMQSLEGPSAQAELRDEWLAAASRRAEELDNGAAVAIPAVNVFEKAAALWK